jgi:carbonic anhydrase/acetyltransferase-like protein (isoleucine patch superfamily)
MIREYQGHRPTVRASAYVDPAAVVIGRVEIGERSSIWPHVTIRGDINTIHIGAETSIQDNTVCHVDHGFTLHIGNRVTVGHSVVLHGCTVEDDALIGIGAIVLNGAKVGKGAVVAAGALVTEGTEIPAGMLAMGSPAKVRREVTPEEQGRFHQGMLNYIQRAQEYLEQSREDTVRGQAQQEKPQL